MSAAGYSGFLAYVADTRVEGTLEFSGVNIVRDFLDAFLEDLSGVTSERQVEFQIDMVHGVTLIAKVSYRIVPPEMQELSIQLQ